MNKQEIVKLLVKNSFTHKIDLNIKNFTGNTGFHLICIFGHFNIAKMLLQNYIPKSISTRYENEQCRNNRTIGMNLASHKMCNIDFNVRDHCGFTGFYYASIHGHRNIVEMMLETSYLDLRDFNGSLRFVTWVSTVCHNFECTVDLI